MHQSSMNNMQRCFEVYVKGTALGQQDRIRVLEVGSANVNGSYRQIFAGDRFDYVGVDMEAASGVDVVLADPYHLPDPSGSVDLVISGQMLEHSEFFWLAFAEMARVVKPTGYIFLIAPSAGPIHRFPVDCYRFYPDAYRALAKLNSMELVEVRVDDCPPWHDLVGVFRQAAAGTLSPG